MNNQDYIRKAVELADGWRWLHRDQVEVPLLNSAVVNPFEKQWFHDALAAQLVRQVDATGSCVVTVHGRGTELSPPDGTWIVRTAHGRTMNTIRAIVDSKVLETDSG